MKLRPVISPCLFTSLSPFVSCLILCLPFSPSPPISCISFSSYFYVCVYHSQSISVHVPIFMSPSIYNSPLSITLHFQFPYISVFLSLYINFLFCSPLCTFLHQSLITLFYQFFFKSISLHFLSLCYLYICNCIPSISISHYLPFFYLPSYFHVYHYLWISD